MFNKWDLWKYTDDNNCWEYVRQFLIIEAGIDPEDVPKFGICPSNKREMTKASIEVAKNFAESGPVQFAVACQFHGKLLNHVGIIDCGLVRHTGKACGTKKEKISGFESKAQKTTYMLHRNLCQR